MVTVTTPTEPAATRSDTRLGDIAKKFTRIEARSKRLDDEHRQAVKDLIADLEWQDIPILYAWHGGRTFGPGTVVHVHQSYTKAEGPEDRFDVHRASDCAGHWCNKPGKVRWFRGKSGRGWKHLGDYFAITSMEPDGLGLWIVVPIPHKP